MKDEQTTAGSCIWTWSVWCLPLLIVPVIIGLFVSIWPVGVLLALGFLAWMGRMHFSDSPGWGKVVLYVFMQAVWIPLFWITIGWGFCAVTGSGTFK